MEALLISACLLGAECKYSGGSNRLPEEQLAALRRRYRLVPVCPETAGGLPVPRACSERRGERVYNDRGEDVTEAFSRGAALALRLAERNGCRLALLKERSPSCGTRLVYDGSFSGKLIQGFGMTAERLQRAGLRLYGESEIDRLTENS